MTPTDLGTRPVGAIGGDRHEPDLTRRRGESLAVLAGFTIVYAATGYWLVVHLHVVGFETLNRLNRGLLLLHDEPASLAVVGVDHPPLSTLAVAPLAAVAPLTGPLVVVPIASSLAAAATMVVLNTLLRRAHVTLAPRLLVLAGVGLNPLVVMQASLGGRGFLWLALVVAALGALAAWQVTAEIRFVVAAGLCLGLAVLTGYTSLVYAVVAAVAVAAMVARRGPGVREVEGTAVGLAAPAACAVGIWTTACLLILGRPFAWVTDSGDRAAPVGGLPDVGPATLAADTGRLVLDGAPLAIAVLPLLLLHGLVRRNGFAVWLGVLLAVAVLVPGAAALLGLTDAPMAMGNALPILLVAVVGAIWLVRSATRRTPAALALGLALVASVPWTFAAMPDFAHQGLERPFHDAVATGDSQEGVRTVSGTVVGYDEERAMGHYIRDHVEGTDAVLTDDAETYAVMLFSGRPDLFLERAGRSVAAWSRAACRPAGPVGYLLLSTDPTYDLLSRRYPAAAQGTDPALREVFATDRYRLVELAGVPTSSAPHDDARTTGSAC